MSSDDEQASDSDDEGMLPGAQHEANVQPQVENHVAPQVRRPSTIMELMHAQQTNGVPGVRLTFHNDFALSITMESNPYFTCALQGLTDLAAVLHHCGIPRDSDLRVASFSARGPSDESPWQTSMTISPSQAALLAGFSDTSAVLQQIESGVPLLWEPRNHALCPTHFKQKVSSVMEALCSSQMFVGLPGPARIKVVHHLVSSMCRQDLWSSVTSESGLWGAPCVIRSEQAAAWEAARKLTTKRNKAAAEHGEPLAAFNFTIRGVRGSLVGCMARFLSRLTAGSAAVHMSRALGCCAMIPTAGIFCAAFASPVSAMLIVSSFKLNQRFMRRFNRFG